MAFMRPDPDGGPHSRSVNPGSPSAHVSLADAHRAALDNRADGPLFSKLNSRLGSLFAAFAIRYGIHPSVVTLIGLIIAIGASVLIIADVDQARQWWLTGLVACVCWQLTYVLDCTDGQVARATGKKSDFGARLDVLVDFAAHFAVICAILTVIARWSDSSIPLIVTCAAMWPVNILTAVLARTDENVGHSFTVGGHLAAPLKLIRDTGFILFVIGLWVFVDPKSIIYPVVAITAFNGVFLLASIGRELYLSIRSTRGTHTVYQPHTEVRS